MAQVGTNKEGTAHKWPLCAPITLAHLLTLYLALDFCIHFHSAIWALALAAFFSCCHLGELTIPSHNAFKAKLHAFHHPANIQFHSHHNGSKSAHFCIPWTKTTKEEGATVVITAWNVSLCPNDTMCKHFRSSRIQMNTAVPEDFALFAYMDKEGKPQSMVKSDFLEFVTDVWM